MASALSSSTPASPRAGVIRVLVGALADDSVDVREAALVALQDNAHWNARTVLDCCMTSLRTVRRRASQIASYHARVFRVMGHTVRVMDEQELDVGLMRKIAKLALLEMTSNKDINAVWQRAASGLIVAIGSRLPDLMMDEVFLQLTGSVVSASAVVQTLAEFALTEASQFTPRVKGVFSRVLPLLGCVKDGQRIIFATAFKCWCWAISQYYDGFPSAAPLDGDTIAFLHSAFELFLGSWVTSRELKMRLVTVEALGEMVPLVSEMHLKTALTRLLPVILSTYKKEKYNPLSVTRSLHVLLDAVLKPRDGIQLLDFQGLNVVLNTLLPLASTYSKYKICSDSSVVLKNLNEVLQCFLTIGTAFNDELFTYLISRVVIKEDSARLGAISVFQHLLPRLHDAWDGRRSQLVDAIKSMLYEQDLSLRKALVELVVAMASIGWVEKSSGEPFVDFLARQCAISKEAVEKYKVEEAASKETIGMQTNNTFKTQLKVGVVSPSELRTMCDKAMLLLAGTMPEIEAVLWPYLLRLIIHTDYTGAVSTICKCISDIARRRLASGISMEIHLSLLSDSPKPEDILARLLVLLQNPHGRDQLALRILTVLFYLGDLFPKAVALLWEDEIPKLKAYLDDPEDLKPESWQQATWDDMIVHLLAESLDVIQSTEWTMSLGNAFADQYDLYVSDHAHSALLHRCLGILLQRVDNRFYVREKLEVMYKNAVISDVTNRLGLAMGFGLVAAAHLDTVLEKLRRILETQRRNRFQRWISMFVEQKSKKDVDDVYAALALMYGYAASYAPSSVIEARIDALVGTDMLSNLLDVRTATAKRAVITAMDLLGQSVIKAAAQGAPFPLKKRDQMLNYTLTLMEGQDSSTDDPELLETQILALNACTTLVSVDPKLTVATRDLILQAILGFFALPIEPKLVIDSVISKLTSLLRAILLTSGEDGRSRADQLQHLLKALDQYVSSPVECQRSRACTSVLDLLREFQSLCGAGTCSLGCSGPCMHLRPSTNRLQRIAGLESTGIRLLPSRDSLNLGERMMAYLPRCADVSALIRKCSAQILDLLFSIALRLPNPVGSAKSGDASFAALSALEELIATAKWDSNSEGQGTLFQLVDHVSDLMTSQELVAALRGCTIAICDKTRSSGKGAIRAVTQLIQKRGQVLNEGDIQRLTQSLLTAAGMVGEKAMRMEILGAVCCLAEHTQAKLVFDELLAAAERDLMTKDVSRLRGGWPVQESFNVLAQDELMAVRFLDYIVAILNQAPPYKDDDGKSDHSEYSLHSHPVSQMPQAAIIAIAAFFRKGTVSRKAVEEKYSAVFCALLLHFGSCHGLSLIDVQPLRNAIKTFQEFCDCVNDKEMKKNLALDGDQLLAGEQWTVAIGQLASCVTESRPKEVENICRLLWPVLICPYEFHRAVAAAVLSEYVHQCNKEDSILLSHLVGALTAQISDESWVVRQLCVKGLVEIPKEEMPNYTSQVLTVMVALIEDVEEEVALTVVQGLIRVLEHTTEETVAPILLNLCAHLRTLQLRRNMHIRAAAFGAIGFLTRFGSVQHEAFKEQLHATLPRLVFHLHDEASAVRQSCKTTLKNVLFCLNMEAGVSLTNSRAFNSDHRLDYEDFLKNFTRQLIDFNVNRIDSYITVAIQNFDSPWPEIQANAAFFAGCLLSQLTDQDRKSVV